MRAGAGHETGLRQTCPGAVDEPDGETVRDAFFDHRFKP